MLRATRATEPCRWERLGCRAWRSPSFSNFYINTTLVRLLQQASGSA